MASPGPRSTTTATNPWHARHTWRIRLAKNRFSYAVNPFVCFGTGSSNVDDLIRGLGFDVAPRGSCGAGRP